MNNNLYLGIMTGTSLDAIDLAIARFPGDTIEIISLEERTFSKELQSYLKSLSPQISLKDLSQLNIRFTEEIVYQVNQFVSENELDKSKISAIGFHGQTLWHQPDAEDFLGKETRSTFQLGSASLLAIRTGIDVVADFRTADMALGGEGAPLVPVFDYAFLGEANDVVVLNIGGIANITYLKANCTKQDIIAFDTGPGNCLIDLAMRNYFNQDYDRDGQIARNGGIDETVLSKLMQAPYIGKNYPKSTGKELFNQDFMEKNGIMNLTPESAITTLTHFTALSIAENIERATKENFTLKIAGGGAKNLFLIELLNHYLPKAKIERATLNGIDISDGREALLMSYLAYLRVNELAGNMPSVTGAGRSTVLGSIAKAGLKE